ncbi:uncharacterized protein CBL_07045 [Carabus blaptoides fortunei]
MTPAIGPIKRSSFQVQKAAKEVKDKIGSRQMLTVFVTTGFVLCGIVEQSATVALLANNPSPISAAEFADYVENTSYITRYCQPPDTFNITDKNDSNRHVHVVLSLPHIEIPMSRTDETESVLREAFMWGTLVSPLAASRIAARAGAESLFGFSVLGAGILALLVPAAWLSPYHVALRIVQGMCMGATWPAAHMLAVTWFKPKHVSGFVSCYTAVNLGYAVVGLLGTPLVRTVGRDILSYAICLTAVLWYFLWWRFVEESLSPSMPKRDEHRNLPWRRLLLSGPAWACGVAVVGSQWADATLMLGVTKYLKLVYGFSTAHEHVLASLPHIGHFLAAIIFGFVVDHIRSSGIVSTTTARKFFVYISHFIPATLMFVLGYTGCDPAAPAALYTAALMLTGATPAGVYASAADIAPNYAGTVFGLCQTIGAAGLLAANYVVSEGLHGSFAGWWRLVFGASSAVLLITATAFMAIGSGSVQDWNNPETDETDSITPEIPELVEDSPDIDALIEQTSD